MMKIKNKFGSEESRSIQSVEESLRIAKENESVYDSFKSKKDTESKEPKNSID